MERRYFHGTRLNAAVISLMQGEPLKAMRPSGSSRFTRSEVGQVYLTPSFKQAREYAWMTDRADWPDMNRNAFTDPKIFEFSIDPETAVRPEEDELGYAIKVSFCRILGQRHHWNMNTEFAGRLINDQDLQEALVGVVTDNLGQGKWSVAPTKLTGADCTKLGKRLLRSLPAELAATLVDAGISVATTVAVRPSAFYRLEAGVFEQGDAQRVLLNLDHADAQHEIAFRP